MKRFFYVLMVVLVALFMSSCKSADPVANARPAWIDNPGNGVSASAGMHVRGRAAQEDLAIMRAREEYAKRFGVSVQSVQTMLTTVANDKSSTVGTQAEHEETNQVGIKAKVKEKWHDPDSDVLWVWLVPGDE